MDDIRQKIDQWKQLVERLPLAIYTAEINENSTTTYISPQIERMLGFAQAAYEANPNLWLDLIHKDDRKRVISDVTHCHEFSGKLNTEYRIITRDGHVVWVNDTAEVIRDKNVGVYYLLGILTDISDRKAFQKKLAESEIKYRHIVENTSDLVVKVDREGRFLFVSPSYCELFGMTEKELLGNRFIPLVHEEDREVAEQAMQALSRPPYTAYVEQRAMTKSGWRWLAWKDNSIVDAKGQITSIIGVGRDITDKVNIAEALEKSQHQLHDTLEYARLGYWELHKDIQTANWSDEIYQIFGIEKSSESESQTLKNLVHPDDCSAVIHSLNMSLTKGHEHHIDYRIKRSDGTQRWVECKAKPVRRTDGTIEKLSGFLQDITARKNTEEALKESEERFRIVATASNDVIYEWHINNDNLRWYGDIDQALGYSPGEFSHTISAWIAAIHPDDRLLKEKEVKRIQSHGGKIDITYRIAAADGSWRIWRDTGQTIKSDDGESLSLIGGCIDITEQRTAEEKIHHLAFHDSLTGLPNRVMFKEELQQVLENYRRSRDLFALHYLDLDYFKDINDSLGHQVGDELLCEVVSRIKGITRGADLFARLGGDEFGLIQSKIDDASQASIFASKVIQQIAREFKLKDKSIRINTSIGIIVPDDENTSADDLLKKADTALYKAKDAGRGTYAFFHDSMTLKLQREMELIHYLSSAIKHGEFFLEYQPQYSLSDRRLVGLEALIRWDHPERGILVPDDFLPIAEKRGLIREISEWALLTACQQARQWSEEERDFGRIAVNLCAIQVNSDDFYEKTLDVLRMTNLPPHLLELEFTETVLMKTTDSAKNAIKRLSQLGIQFAIDDFGTGFSSLSYLKYFHADKIKIDREFIQDMVADPSDAEIVKATIALGTALGMEIMAEGVENQAQEDFLIEHGCNHVQGFYYGRPMQISDIEDLLG